MPLYNNARFLPAAIDSLLNQTYTNFGIVLLDDQSTDGTEAVARDYAERHSRVRYVRNEHRLGLIAAWRRAFELAQREFPSAPYFAWASDHDLWATTWLETLVRELDTRPEVLLAYPWTKRMSEAGVANPKPEPTRFDTTGIGGVAERWAFMCEHLIGAGNMVYGLVRARALERAGIYRDVILPDRLLMAELTLQGQFLQVPEVLWFRREVGVSSIARQRRTLFGLRRAPLHAYLPWPLVHTASLLMRYGLKHEDPALQRLAILRACTRYLVTQSRVQYRKASLQRRRRRQAARAAQAGAGARPKGSTDMSPPSPRGASAMSDHASGWLDRRLDAAIVRPLSARFTRELSEKLKEDLAQGIAGEQAETRRLRKVLKALHEEMTSANAATAAALADLFACQQTLLDRHEALADAVAALAARLDVSPIETGSAPPTDPSSQPGRLSSPGDRAPAGQER